MQPTGCTNMEWNMERNMKQHICKLAVQSVYNHKHYTVRVENFVQFLILPYLENFAGINSTFHVYNFCVQAIYGYPFFLQLIALIRVFTARYIILSLWTNQLKDFLLSFH